MVHASWLLGLEKDQSHLGRMVVGNRLLPVQFVCPEPIPCSGLRITWKMGEPRTLGVKYKGISSIHLSLQQEEVTETLFLGSIFPC